MKTQKFILGFVLGLLLVVSVACGGTSDPAPTAAVAEATSKVTETAVPIATEIEAAAAEATAVCESYFQFCTTVSVSGAVSAKGVSGIGGSGKTCAEWAQGGAARILEMPTVLPLGENKMTVALTRLGSYTGPGTYTMVPVVTSGNPDSFPTIDVEGRTFSYGEGSTAVVTVAADGSGTVEAKGLVELSSMMVSEPDPAARLDFSMQWLCQETE